MKRFHLDFGWEYNYEDPKQEAAYYRVNSNMTSQGKYAHLLPGAKDVVIKANKIVVLFDYCLADDYTVAIRSKTGHGFTKQALLKALVQEYRKLWKNGSNMHYWADLVIEGIVQKPSGAYELEMGS